MQHRFASHSSQQLHHSGECITESSLVDASVKDGNWREPLRNPSLGRRCIHGSFSSFWENAPVTAHSPYPETRGREFMMAGWSSGAWYMDGRGWTQSWAPECPGLGLRTVLWRHPYMQPRPWEGLWQVWTRSLRGRIPFREMPELRFGGTGLEIMILLETNFVPSNKILRTSVQGRCLVFFYR